MIYFLFNRSSYKLHDAGGSEHRHYVFGIWPSLALSMTNKNAMLSSFNEPCIFIHRQKQFYEKNICSVLCFWSAVRPERSDIFFPW